MRARILAMSLLPFFLFACAGTPAGSKPLEVRRAEPHELPAFRDDLDLEGLIPALERQLRSKKFPSVQVGADRFGSSRMRRTAERLHALAKEARQCLYTASAEQDERCRERFASRIRKEFLVFTPKAPARFTAYYTPLLHVSRKRGGPFVYPVYAPPRRAALRALPRSAIDFDGVLADHGLELFYARDRFDVYVAHVEGGARLLVEGEEGPPRYLSYTADNGHRFRLIEEYMRKARMLPGADVSRMAQRRYLAGHPEREREVYATCPLYVYFRETAEPPPGSDGVVLSEGRSLASDPDYYPKGMIAFVESRRPVRPHGKSPESNPFPVKQAPLRRFFVDQDIGPYIRGPNRFDLFFGEGEEAVFLGNNLQSQGRIYFLVLAKE